MVECIFAWVSVIVAFIKMDPMWAVAAALFAIASQLYFMAKDGDNDG